MIEFSIKKELLGVNGVLNLDVSMKLENGEFLALSGDSGSGKTTILRCLAGLEKSKAYIKVDNEIYQDDKVFLPPQKRSIGFVFQDYALFENLSVERNLLFANQDKFLCDKILSLLDLTKLKNRKPHTLSGGQKQRVALGRAVMRMPKILLLDEPLSALDVNLRSKLQDEILKIHKEFNITTILISHDSDEIYKLANRMAILEGGKFTNIGTPKQILLKTKGSQKFAFYGRVLEIQRIDCVFLVTISIAQQLTQVVVCDLEDIKVGDNVMISTKAFNLNLSKI
ncbi:ATP-binding cassette domain-containing protein [Campylobacter sp. FMV-PI01]|uniref:ATP-binding cassette domain-containing protein n=1 Tax=Campylobacter portucalensis TaxID=2608384 RepID=A0A6L5WFT1_9BACT|nr:ATP-binding cassette domain-containing protein [Campylobacter portucalensis]MSN95960.1 ATP-binding cassette domain-containing protein [Campylobacter portucalensis]